MNFKEKKQLFEKEKKIYQSTVLEFKGVEGFDVYNCSVPFTWNGVEYIYGRIERRDEWARSWVRLFRKTGKDQYSLEENSMIYQLEDPYIAVVSGEIIMGGTHVRKKNNTIDTYYGYFYHGTDLEDLYYFTTGPDYMKDIRLVQMIDGKIGVFSRPKNEEVKKIYGSESLIGFEIIDSLEDLNADVVLNARPIEELFEKDEWGGCNQAYLLEDGTIGVIGHKSYREIDKNGIEISVYVNNSFEFDPNTFKATNQKIIGTRSCYPPAVPKIPALIDCTFTSGITKYDGDDKKVNLYGGMGDTCEGRIVIDYPFSKPIIW